jgi:predicted transposase YdaD
MSKPYDAATKYLVEANSADWLALAGVTGVEAEVINAELSTVTAAADRAIFVKSPAPWLVNLALQSDPDPTLEWRVLEYSVLLGKEDLPVQSIVVLLRRAADRPKLTGIVRRHLPDGRCYQWFQYDVVRLWEQPVETLLEGGLGTLPLAPLANVKRKELPGVIQRMKERIDREVPPRDVPYLWTATYVLMGLRYSSEVTHRILSGVRDMKESVTYQEIVKEGVGIGATRESRNILLLQGRKRFGKPSVKTRRKIESIASVKRLEALAERLLDVHSWEELLADE